MSIPGKREMFKTALVKILCTNINFLLPKFIAHTVL